MLKLINDIQRQLVVNPDLVSFLQALHLDGEDPGTIVGILSDAEKWREEIEVFVKTGALPFDEADENGAGETVATVGENE
jgi:hypothetical protein